MRWASEQPQERAVGVETPGPSGGDDLQGGLALAVDQLVAEPTAGVLVGQFDHGRAEPLDVDDRDQAVGQDAPDRGPTGQIFKPCHASPVGITTARCNDQDLLLVHPSSRSR